MSHREGAHTVILAFDDPANVPQAKRITQAKRRVGVVALEFNDSDPLPDRPPELWAAAMCNRAFKTKIQSMVHVMWCVPTKNKAYNHEE